MKTALSALIIEDSEDDALLMVRELSRANYEVTYIRVETAFEMEFALAERDWDIILCDYRLPQFIGTEALEIWKKKHLNMPFIFVSGTMGEDIAVAAMKAGADDYVMKNNLTRLPAAVARELEEAESRLRRENAEKLYQIQHASTRILLEANTLEDAIPLILKTFCLHINWQVGEFWLVDKAANMIRCNAIWHKPGAPVEEFINISRQLDFVPGVGLPGRVWASKKPRWIGDIALDTDSPRAPFAAKCNLHGALAFPVLFSGSVLGVIEFFNQEITSPNEELQELFATISSQIALFIHKKRTEEALRKSEEQYRQLVELPPCGIFVVCDNEVVFANSAFARILGEKDAGQIINKKVMDFIHPEYHSLAEDRMQFLHKFGTPTSLTEEKFLRKDGSVIEVEVVANTVDYHGKPAVQFIIQDISERKQAQRELFKSEGELRLALDASHMNCWEWDIKTNEIKEFGYFAKIAEGGYAKFLNNLHPADREKVNEALAKAVEGVEYYDVEFRVIVEGDRIEWIAARGEVIRDKKGKAERMIGVGMLITDRKKAEESQREIEQWLQVMLDNATTIISLKDVNGKYLLVNRQFEKIFLVTKGDVLGKTNNKLFEKRIAAVLSQNDRKVLKHATSLEFEEIIPRNGKDKYYITVRFPLFNSAGDVYAIGSISTDITDRKLAEKNLLQAYKEKEILLKEIYHRMKNNLQVISSLLNLQSLNLNGGSQEALQSSADRIKAMGLIHEQLCQSHNLSEIEFSQYVKALVDSLLCAYAINKDKIQVILEIKKIFISVDVAFSCGLIINELVTNAFKYAFLGKETGTILIKFTKNKKNQITLEAIDDGVGFPQDIDFKHTTSLGMQLVCNLTQQLDGEIKQDLTSGTHFTIKFIKKK